MTSCRIKERLANARHGGALMPYFTSGFPDVATTAELIRRADRLGVAAVEIGVPYSDSIADGPVIQSSFCDALAGGHRVDHAFHMVRALRDDVDCALVAMLSYSIVFRHGLDRFMAEAAGAGFDGVIIPDVPVEESKPVADAAQEAGLCTIGLVAPTTEEARCRAIVANATGFIYQIATAGTTGERTTMSEALEHDVSSLRRMTRLPICVGFGISTADHVRDVCRFADGAIVGTVLVRRIRDAMDQGLERSALVDAVAQSMAQLLTGLEPST